MDQICGNDVKILATFSGSFLLSVNMIELAESGERFVVKKLLHQDKHSLQIIGTEWQAYNALKQANICGLNILGQRIICREWQTYNALKQANISGLNILEVDENLSSLKEGRMVISPVGETLIDIIAAEQIGDPKFRRSKFVIQLAIKQLELLHKSGWIHADVRPQNILIVSPTATGEEDLQNSRVYLIDLQTTHKAGAITAWLPQMRPFFPTRCSQ